MSMLGGIVKTNGNALTIIVRVMVGVVFVLEGLQKFLYPDDLGVGRFLKIGLPMPQILAPLVGFTEIAAGLAVLFGLLTRVAALALAAIMLVAVISTKIPILLGHEIWGFSLRKQERYGFLSMAHEMRTDWAMLLGSIYLLIGGGGRWAVDHALSNKHNQPYAVEEAAD